MTTNNDALTYTVKVHLSDGHVYTSIPMDQDDCDGVIYALRTGDPELDGWVEIPLDAAMGTLHVRVDSVSRYLVRVNTAGIPSHP